MTTDPAGDVRDSETMEDLYREVMPMTDTQTRPDPQECAGSGWVASTPIEGVWTFTLSDTPEHALSKMDDAIIWRRILCYPIDNPISAVRYP